MNVVSSAVEPTARRCALPLLTASFDNVRVRSFTVQPWPQVSIGGQACHDVVVIDSLTLTCVTPPGTGLADVVLTITGQPEARLPRAFAYTEGRGLVFISER
jgi:hypothetical protein